MPFVCLFSHSQLLELNVNTRAGPTRNEFFSLSVEVIESCPVVVTGIHQARLSPPAPGVPGLSRAVSLVVKDSLNDAQSS